MALSAFDDKTKPPQDGELKTTLGTTFALWTRLKAAVAKDLGPVTEVWGFASKSTGWGLRLKQKDRVILYMTPCQGYFLASMALGEKAVALAHERKLPAAVLDVIDTAKKYAEGRGVRIEVRTAKDVQHVRQLVEVKAGN